MWFIFHTKLVFRWKLPEVLTDVLITWTPLAIRHPQIMTSAFMFLFFQKINSKIDEKLMIWTLIDQLSWSLFPAVPLQNVLVCVCLHFHFLLFVALLCLPLFLSVCPLSSKAWKINWTDLFFLGLCLCPLLFLTRVSQFLRIILCSCLFKVLNPLVSVCLFQFELMLISCLTFVVAWRSWDLKKQNKNPSLIYGGCWWPTLLLFWPIFS